MTFRVGVDIGGTFTDTVAVDENGAMTFVKVPSTPPDFYTGLVDGVTRLGRPLDEMSLLAHGTTVGINAIVTRRGAKTGLVTTRGFRDTLQIRRGDREEQFNLWWQPAPALIPRKYRFEIDERIGYDGAVLVPLDEDQVVALAARIRRIGLESIAIIFINSPVNYDHERRTANILREELPGVYVTASFEILPEILESERTATTSLNAYIGPVMDSYVRNLEERLGEKGYRGDIAIATSAGGVATPELVRRVPARTVESGPAAGVMAAAEISRLAGFPHVATFDMGGTSLDVGLIRDGVAHRTNEYIVEWGMPIRFPSIDVHSIGAGGGSIAWLDSGGLLRVGPQSAGARPGPACYGAGGEEPTTTDAQIVLGRMNPESFLGGAMTLDADLARRAIETRIGHPLGLGLEEAADAILAIANNNMVQALRLATVERGYDPREFALFALGGAGPVYASEVARAGSIPTVLVPRYPGLTSALGLLVVDIRHDVSHSVLKTQQAVTVDELNAVFTDLESRVAALLASEGVGSHDISLSREIDLRYFGQSEGFTIAVSGGVLSDASYEAILESFFERQLREFGYLMPKEVSTVEFVTARVGGVGKVEKVSLPRLDGGGDAPSARTGARRAWFGDGFVETAVYDRQGLGAGAEIEGPAIVEQTDSTTVVLPGSTARVDDYGNLVITVSA